MPPSTWKSIERKIANLFGGQRRGADYRNRFGSGGKNDITGVPGFSIEVKHAKSPTYGLIQSAVKQAKDNRDDQGDLPLAIIHKAYSKIGDSLVFVEIQDYMDHYVSPELQKYFRATDAINSFHVIYKTWNIIRLSFLRVTYGEIISAVRKAEARAGSHIPVVFLDELGNPIKYVVFRLETFLSFYHISTS